MINKNTGIYTLYKVLPNDELELIGRSDNLVVDKGLDAICSKGSETIISKCFISSDISAITSDLSGVATAATTNTILASSYGASNKVPYYYWYKVTYEFPFSPSSINVTKVGILTNDNILFSIASFKDPDGNPIAIQVLKDERLRVVYEYRVYISTDDIVLKDVKLFNNENTLYNITIRPSQIGNNSIAQYLHNGLYIMSDGLRAYKGSIGSIKDSPSEQLFSKNSIQVLPYVSGSFVKTFVLSFGYDEFNSVDGIAALSFVTSKGAFQIKIDPPIKKTNKHIMTMSIPITVGR